MRKTGIFSRSSCIRPLPVKESLKRVAVEEGLNFGADAAANINSPRGQILQGDIAGFGPVKGTEKLQGLTQSRSFCCSTALAVMRAAFLWMVFIREPFRDRQSLLLKQKKKDIDQACPGQDPFATDMAVLFLQKLQEPEFLFRPGTEILMASFRRAGDVPAVLAAEKGLAEAGAGGKKGRCRRRWLCRLSAGTVACF